MSMYGKLLGVGLAVLLGVSVVAAQPRVGPSSADPVNMPTNASDTLMGSEWSGQEALENFGALTFHFTNPGQVTMIDAQGKWPGSYLQNGNQVTLAFFNGDVLYKGDIAGASMNGIAEAKKGGKWNFQVTRKNTAPVINLPPANRAIVNVAAAPGTVPFIPSAPGSNTAAAPGQGAPIQAGKVTPDNLAEYLRKMGFEPRQVQPQGGVPYCVLNLKENDGWSFVVEVHVNNGIWLVAPLAQLPSQGQVPLAKVMSLLEANNTLAPCFFSYRPGDNRLCLRLEVIGLSEQNFRADLRVLLNHIRTSHNLWNTAAWQTVNTAAN
jgi:hypothetical protein